jgi:hypothetical protein
MKVVGWGWSQGRGTILQNKRRQSILGPDNQIKRGCLGLKNVNFRGLHMPMLPIGPPFVEFLHVIIIVFWHILQ